MILQLNIHGNTLAKICISCYILWYLCYLDGLYDIEEEDIGSMNDDKGKYERHEALKVQTLCVTIK